MSKYFDDLYAAARKDNKSPQDAQILAQNAAEEKRIMLEQGVFGGEGYVQGTVGEEGGFFSDGTPGKKGSYGNPAAVPKFRIVR